MRTRWRRWSYGLGMAAALAAGSERAAQAGPIIDWFKSWCQPLPSSCSSGNCNTPKPNPYYPAANTPPTLPGPVIQPGAVIQPGTVIQPGAAQPGFLQPNPSFPSTVTPGPAIGPRMTNFPPLVSQTTYYAPATAAASTVTSAAPVAQATYYAPATQATYYAPAAQSTYYASSAVANSAACPTCPAPTAVPGATPGVMPGVMPGAVSSARPTIVNYAPYLSYRDQWVRVAVTYYRPVSVVDPTTGAVTTAMQPCTATAWQVQRVPVAGRSFLSRYQPLPSSGGTALGAPAVVMPSVAPGQPNTCVNGLCQPSQSYSGWTLPSTPSIVAAPVAPPPQTIVMPAPSNANVPGANMPAANVPAANTRPTLLPGEGANSVNYPPLSPVPSGSLVPVPSFSSNGASSAVPPYIPPAPSAEPPAAAPTDTFRSGAADPNATQGLLQKVPVTEDAGNGDSNGNPSGSNPSGSSPSGSNPPRSDAYESGPPLSSPNTTFVPSARSGSSLRSAVSPPASSSPLASPPASRPSGRPSSDAPSAPSSGREAPTRVTPVPDPDAAPFRVPQHTTPRLIVPRDRVAASSPSVAQPVRRVVPSVTAPRTDRWDGSGWRSAAPSTAAAPAVATATAARK